MKTLDELEAWIVFLYDNEELLISNYLKEGDEINFISFSSRKCVISYQDFMTGEYNNVYLNLNEVHFFMESLGYDFKKDVGELH